MGKKCDIGGAKMGRYKTNEDKIGDVNCFQLYRRSDETIDIYLDDEFISNKPDIHAAEIYVKNFDYAGLYQNVDMVS